MPVTPLTRRPAWLTSAPIAHRGLHDLSAGRPENSLAAFEAAAQAGYPCELDVRLTRGGELIVLHDSGLSRAAGLPGRAADLTAADLPGTRLFGTSEPIPTLAQVIDRVDGRIPLQIEIKRDPGDDPRTLAAAVLAALREADGQRAAYGRHGDGEHGDGERYAISSFDPFIVRQLRAARSPYPVGQISGLADSRPLLARLAGRWLAASFLTRPDFLSHELAGLPSPVVRWWRRRGVPVLAWGVTSPEDEARAGDHADNIIFDGFLPSPG